jgi:protoporphyrin/coproporphyrin ferrochelatase
VHVLFSAHGLPRQLVERGDPYLAQVKATVQAVMHRLDSSRPWSLAFQSRATRVAWLEPFTQDALAALARQGVREVAVVPIAFLTEHVETLFELDMLIRDQALAAGIEGYHRVPALNDSPALIDCLAGLVRRVVERGSDEGCCYGRVRPCPRTLSAPSPG